MDAVESADGCSLASKHTKAGTISSSGSFFYTEARPTSVGRAKNTALFRFFAVVVGSHFFLLGFLETGVVTHLVGLGIVTVYHVVFEHDCAISE